MVYECAAGEDAVITNVNINTFAPVLQLQQLAGI
jgi:hypothetical protein